MSYIYKSLMLFIFVFLPGILIFNTRKLPVKIKVNLYILISAFCIRFFTLFLYSILSNLEILNYIKPFYYLNLAAVPCTLILCIYVFTKSVNFNFNYIYLLETAIFITYFYFAFRLDSSISMGKNFVYILTYDNSLIIYIIMIIFNTLIALYSYFKSCRNNIRRLGFKLLFITSLISILEVYLKIFNLNFLPELILCDIFYGIVLYYAVSLFTYREY